MICNQCPRKCNALRTEKENINGFCKAPLLPKIARAGLHFWEEPIISGKSGSGTVFFSGCNLRCVYCQNYDISQNKEGKMVSVNRLAEIFKELEQKGANNINLVTPSHYVYAIIEALSIYKPNIPVVYNCGGYELPEIIEKLKDYVDIYLFDFKYSSCKSSEMFSSASDYPIVAKDALLTAFKQTGKPVVENGIMKKGVIVRHLLLPGATKEAIEIFDYVKNNCNGSYFSLMGQYVPLYRANEFKRISRKVTKREYEKVASYIINSGYENCFLQELSSADENFIPSFDLSGV